MTSDSVAPRTACLKNIPCELLCSVCLEKDQLGQEDDLNNRFDAFPKALMCYRRERKKGENDENECQRVKLVRLNVFGEF